MPLRKKRRSKTITIPLRITKGGRVFNLSIIFSKNRGSFAGIIIFLLVRTLSDKGTIIPKETPLKIAEIIMQNTAKMNTPR